MATIEDLPIPDFSKLSDEELQGLILKVRGRRREPDPVIKEKAQKIGQAKAKKGKPMALSSVSSLLNGLSKEDAAKLLETLRSSK